MLRDSIAYGIASILQVEGQVKCGFSSRVSAPISFDYFSCIISNEWSRDTDSYLRIEDLFNFAKIQNEDLMGQSATSWFVSLKREPEAADSSQGVNFSGLNPPSQVQSESADRVMMHLATIYKLDGVFLPIKAKVLTRALIEPLPDKRQFGVPSQQQLERRQLTQSNLLTQQQ